MVASEKSIGYLFYPSRFAPAGARVFVPNSRLEANPRKRAGAVTQRDRRMGREIDDSRESRGACAGVDDQVDRAPEGRANRLGVVERFGRAREDQRRRQDRL